MKLDLPKDVSNRYVLAFSGGADSALLAYLLKEQSYVFRLVHVVHPDSKASKDGENIKKFCENWAKTYRIPIKCLAVSIDATKEKTKGTESAEREARYEALYNELHSGEILLTAHHLDDSIETLLFRLARGTSVKGMSGIQKKTPDSRVFRPLLSLTKAEILQQVEAAAILYGHDSTNDDTKLSRNFIRNKIVPLFVDHFSASKFYSSVKRAMENFSECSELMEDLFYMDTQICGSNETGIHRVAFSSLSDRRQRNFIYYLIQNETKLFPTRNCIEEIRKRLKSNRRQFEVTVSNITIVVSSESFFLRFTNK